MNEIQSYRDLIAWQKAMDLPVYVYQETAKLPTDERFGLRGQMRRSAVRIPSTIAEGWGRQSSGDYLRFLKIAQGSLYELVTQSELCRRLEYNGDWAGICSRAEEVGRILHGLGRSVEGSLDHP
jgi:four helix bundle protein